MGVTWSSINGQSGRLYPIDHILVVVSLHCPSNPWSFFIPNLMASRAYKMDNSNAVLSATDLSSRTLCCCPCALPHISILFPAAAASGLAGRSPEHLFWVDHPMTRMEFQQSLVAQMSWTNENEKKFTLFFGTWDSFAFPYAGGYRKCDLIVLAFEVQKTQVPSKN